MNFCKDCKHFVNLGVVTDGGSFYRCAKDGRYEVNVVTGQREQRKLPDCHEEREGLGLDDKCGEQGQHFEPKDPPPEQPLVTEMTQPQEEPEITHYGARE